MKMLHSEVRARLPRSAIAGVLLFVALALQPAIAQTSTPPAPFVLGTPEMKPNGQGSARIYINDAYGQKRAVITPADLVVRFGGQPAAGVRVQPEDNVPLQVVLGLDVSLWNPRDANHTSALTRTVLAAKEMVEAIPDSSFSAFPFSMTLPSAATDNLAWLQNPRLWQGNRTALFAAVDAAAGKLASVDPAKARKVIVLITNSGNTLNTSALARGAWTNSLKSAITNTQAANARVLVFAADEKFHPLSEQRRAELQALVQAAGGDVITTTVAAQLPDLVAKTLADLKRGFRVDFTSTVPVNVNSELEIGLTQAALSRAEVGAQSSLIASFDPPKAFLSPNDEVKLNVDPAWANNIRSAEVFLDGKYVITLLPSNLAFRWGDRQIKDRIRELQPGAQVMLTATVQHGLNRVDVMTETVTVPAIAPLTMTVASVAGQPDDLFANQAFALTARGQNISDVTYVITDAQGGESIRAVQTQSSTRVALPVGNYTLQARAVDEWGRPVQSTLYPLNVGWRILPVLIALSMLVIVALVALWLAFLQRRRAAARVQSIYRLVNYGNAEMEFVVLAHYNVNDFTLHLFRLEMDDVPAQQALPNNQAKLELLTPPIPPQKSVLLHVTIEPVGMRRMPQYDFQLVAYARSQDPAEPEARAFTLRPLHRQAGAEQPIVTG